MSVQAEASLQDAEALFLQGRTDEAAAICESVLRGQPNDPGARRILGMLALIGQDHGRALHLLEPIEADFPNDFRVQIGLAEAKWGMQRIGDAVAHLRRAIALEPGRTHLRGRLGTALLACGEFEAAKTEMEQFLATAPDDVDALTNLGVSLTNLGHTGQAIEPLRRAMRLDPAGHAAPFHLGQALRELGRIDEAIETLREAARRAPAMAYLQIALGDALWGRGHRAEGQDALKRATELDPMMGFAWIKYGDTESAANNMPLAIACYRKAVQLFDGAYEASPFRMLGNALYLNGDIAEATSVMRDGMRNAFWYHGQPRAKRDGLPRVATLCALGRNNTPTDYIIDAKFDPESICMVDGFDYPTDQIENCFDVIFNSASDPDAAPAAIELAETLTSRMHVPVINAPSKMAATMRHRTPEKLSGIPGLHVPQTRRLQRDDLLASADRLLAGLQYPVLLRPAGSHGGTGLVRIESQASLLITAQAMSSDAFYVTEYYDFSSTDGLFRKLRIIFVDGQPFPLHLSISDHWLNHYHRTRTAQEEMLRREEAAFLQDPASYLGQAAYDAAAQVGQRHDLGFFGLDGALDRDGKLIVFECNATMLVRFRDQPDLLAHKGRVAEAIRSAMGDLLVRVARG